MMTVNEVSKLTGVSIRALQYYDKIGLLHPAEYTEAGYRLYDDTALERLQQILLFRELEFSLKEIQSILQSPDFDRDRALDQQICLLTLKKEHIENLITFARGLKQVGGMNMDFSASDVFESYSAGTETKPQINQDAVRLMKAIYGIDMEQTQYSKLISDIPEPDIAISMGCNVGCPFIGRPFDDNWELEDPTGKSDEEFEKVIDEIRVRIMELKQRLGKNIEA